jgi:intracellular multiplication protein IcmS
MNTNKLIAIAKSLGKYYTLRGSQLRVEDVFSETGLLPGLARRADQIASMCFGYGLGATLEDDEAATLGKKVVFDDFTPDSLRIFCILDSLMEIIKGNDNSGVVSMDELLYD